MRTTPTMSGFLRWVFVGLGAALVLATLAFGLPTVAVRATTFDYVITCASSGSGSLPVVFAAASGDTIVFSLDCTSTTGGVITLPSTLTVSKNLTVDASVGGTV